LKLLSFGEDAQAQEQELSANQTLKIKSAHDAIANDPRLSKEAVPITPAIAKAREQVLVQLLCQLITLHYFE
jgi:hypothetical protein